MGGRDALQDRMLLDVASFLLALQRKLDGGVELGFGERVIVVLGRHFTIQLRRLLKQQHELLQALEMLDIVGILPLLQPVAKVTPCLLLSRNDEELEVARYPCELGVRIDIPQLLLTLQRKRDSALELCLGHGGIAYLKLPATTAPQGAARVIVVRPRWPVFARPRPSSVRPGCSDRAPLAVCRVTDSELLASAREVRGRGPGTIFSRGVGRLRGR